MFEFPVKRILLTLDPIKNHSVSGEYNIKKRYIVSSLHV